MTSITEPAVEKPEVFELQPGDAIIVRTAFGVNRHIISRVTTNHAFVRYNEIAEWELPRVFSFASQPIPQQGCDAVSYSIEKAKP